MLITKRVFYFFSEMLAIVLKFSYVLPLQMTNLWSLSWKWTILTIYLLPPWCIDYYLFIKYYSPLLVSSLKCSYSGGYSCIHAAYGNVTLYESSWWPVGRQLEWELEFSLKLCTERSPRTLIESDSIICCMYTTVSSWRWALKARNK